MKISVILGHPDRGSFNHAIAAVAISTLRKNGHITTYHDLYQEGFDPVLPAAEIARGSQLCAEIKQHCSEIAGADGIIIVHPNWWGQPPAIIKGWIDRVLRPGSAYEFLEGDSGAGIPVGLLKAAVALVFNTSNTEPEREQAVFGDPLETTWKNCIFGLCGINNVQRRTFGIIVTSTAQQRAEWLKEVADTVNRYFPKE